MQPRIVVRRSAVPFVVSFAFGLAGAVSQPSTSYAQSAAQSASTLKKNEKAIKEGTDHPLKIQPVLGEYKKYTVQRGESLFAIALRNNVSVNHLRRLNKLTRERVKAGQTLLLPTLAIPPRLPGTGIVLNVPECRVYVFRNAKLVAMNPCAVGRSNWQTALGTFKVRNKAVDPEWTPPRSLVRREGVNPRPIPPGPRNPLGDRWIGWTEPGYGFHSTLSPSSIGNAASHGCVRLYPATARIMFKQVEVNMPILAVYEPIKIGKLNGKYYLSVSPDIYSKGLVGIAQVQKRLDQVGLLPLVNPKTLQQIVSYQDSYAHAIVGTDNKIEVNGQVVPVPIAPTEPQPGKWGVALTPLVTALGGQVAPGEAGAVQITGNGRAYAVKMGSKEATLDGKKVSLPFAPTMVEGTLMAPAKILTDLFDVKATRDKVRGLVIAKPTTTQ